MTPQQYKRLKAALIAQRKRVASSKEEASKFLDESGIRHLLVDIVPKKNSKAATRKSSQ